VECLFFGALLDALDTLFGNYAQFKSQYATGESCLKWEKAGFDPEIWQKGRTAPGLRKLFTYLCPLPRATSQIPNSAWNAKSFEGFEFITFRFAITRLIANLLILQRCFQLQKTEQPSSIRRGVQEGSI